MPNDKLAKLEAELYATEQKFCEEWKSMCRYQNVYHKALIYCIEMFNDTVHIITTIDGKPIS
jgi:hypothetical protein